MPETSPPRVQLEAVASELRERLPRGWEVELMIASAVAGVSPDATITVRAPDGAAGRLALEYKSRLDPALVGPMLSRVARPSPDQVMVVTPFLSLGARKLLRDRGISWADSTGNFRVALEMPVIYIETEGAAKNPFARRDQPLKSLKGPGAAAVVRALCDFRPPYTQSRLAEAAGLAPASVFRVVDLLLKEALADREGQRGPLVAVDWAGIISRWCEDYSVFGSNLALSAIDPRGLDSILKKLRWSDREYALTGSAVASRVAPVAPSRLLVVYTRQPERLADDLGLTATDTGANVQLVEPFSSVLMARGEDRDGLKCAALTQVVADLLTSPGRGPSEAEALLGWMRENEASWRRILST